MVTIGAEYRINVNVTPVGHNKPVNVALLSRTATREVELLWSSPLDETTQIPPDPFIVVGPQGDLMLVAVMSLDKLPSLDELTAQSDRSEDPPAVDKAIVAELCAEIAQRNKDKPQSVVVEFSRVRVVSA